MGENLTLYSMKNTTTSRQELVFQLLKSIPGEKPSRDGLKNTPKRVDKMYKEIFGGYHKNIDSIFKATFESDNDSMVIVQDIDFYSHCEHHMVPFFGKVHIAYIPDGKVLGLSKFARLVEVFARRLQIQEQMTHQIAKTIQKYLHPKGVAVVIKAQHLCMAMRGVQKQNSQTTTNTMLGAFMQEPETRAEFLKFIN